MKLAYIALGTNIGNREENLKMAIESLNRLDGVSVVKQSAVYETEPVGYANQPNFLNMVVAVQTAHSPAALLGACLGIEAAMGRIRQIKNGPRIIDLDLLLYEDFESNTAELTVPHPRMMERRFVLEPLCDICDEAKYHNALKQLKG